MSWKSTRTVFLNKEGFDKNCKCSCETGKDKDRKMSTGSSNRKQHSIIYYCSTTGIETVDRVKKVKNKEGLKAECESKSLEHFGRQKNRVRT